MLIEKKDCGHVDMTLDVGTFQGQWKEQVLSCWHRFSAVGTAGMIPELLANSGFCVVP